ncbi:GntR family transcriptional regulator [Pseudactinotalea sp. HY160]|uniref:GntR family transcriptional regulator n=1 Tax=Pseudactinotalea sp. HY160 TaxID=2654490 RepID=UPI00128C91AE|nr:GntR family transcriptional regulator [Pseudactinotalea sp. HY160]MPV49232.1 GntR family transcriptional regulator [Pseudactinotalea sp. HY160]
MIALDPTGPVPPFEQVRAQLADLVRGGDLRGGHKLPSIRQLAGDLRIAPGTVARAYAALEADGLIEMSRASGTRVREGQALSADLNDAATRFVANVKQHDDATLEAALGAVRAAWERSASAIRRPLERSHHP